ncbi:MAG: hydrogen gas-evolving membrane-bound hydrogenase subunit E [Spirochaetota bacterium]
MELILAVVIILMIGGAIFSLEAKDLLSAVIAFGIVGFGLVICFLLLQAPDLALVQIVIEVITLIIMIAVVLNSTREELKVRWGSRSAVFIVFAVIFAGLFLYFFNIITGYAAQFGEHILRMSRAYVEQPGAVGTGSANLVSGVLFDYRGYDTLGEATVLLTAVIGVLTVLRLKGRK